MKNLYNYIMILILIIAGYSIINNYINPEVVTHIEYVKGDTTVVTIHKETIDTVKVYSYKTIVDTITKHDSIYYSYYSGFNIGDSALGTSGKVSFDMDEFKFSNIKYRYPEVTKTIIDTIKITNNIKLKGLTHGPQAGFGYGLINKEFDIFVGYGIQFAF